MGCAFQCEGSDVTQRVVSTPVFLLPIRLESDQADLQCIKLRRSKKRGANIIPAFDVRLRVPALFGLFCSQLGLAVPVSMFFCKVISRCMCRSKESPRVLRTSINQNGLKPQSSRADPTGRSFRYRPVCTYHCSNSCACGSSMLVSFN